MKFFTLAFAGLFISAMSFMTAAAVHASAELPRNACPNGATTENGGHPVLVIGGAPALMVCGTPEESQKWKGKILLAGFEIYSVQGKAAPEMLLQSGELDRALISKKGNQLQLESLIYLNQDWVPAFRTYYSRSSKHWHKSKEEVILKLPKNASHEQNAEVSSLLAKASSQEPLDEIQIARIFDSAVNGNAAAKEFFLNPKTKTSLDGASAEEYQTDRRILLRLKSASK